MKHQVKKIVIWFSFLVWGIIVGIKVIMTFAEKILLKEQERADKNAYLLRNACQWIIIYQKKKQLLDWFVQNNINEVAIYGLGELGQCLLNELEKSNIEIKYLVDRNTDKFSNKYMCYMTTDSLPEVQVLIITAIFNYKEILNNLNCNMNTRIVSLEDIIMEMNKE